MRAVVPTLTLLGALISSQPAFAGGGVDIATVNRMACSSNKLSKDASTDQRLEPWRLSEAILLLSGHRIEKLAGSRGQALEIGSAAYAGEVNRQMALALGPADDVTGFDAEVLAAIRDSALSLGQTIRGTTFKKPSPGTVRALSEPPPQGSFRYWPLDDARGVALACTAAEVAGAEVPQSPGSLPPRFGLVGEKEALEASGDDRQAVKAASVGFERSLTTKDDGSKERTITWSIDAVTGLRLSGDDNSNLSFLYADYSLSRARKRPAAALEEGQRADDGDTNALDLGLLAPSVWHNGIFNLGVNGGIVFDWVKNSHRIEGKAALGISPPFRNFPLCGFGYLQPIVRGSRDAVRARCSLALESRLGYFIKDGRRSVVSSDNFAQVGGTFLYELVRPLSQKTGIALQIRYRYLRTVDGPAPDISRIEAALRHRWSLDSGGSIDFGVSWNKGREPKSFQLEDVLKLDFGLLF